MTKCCSCTAQVACRCGGLGPRSSGAAVPRRDGDADGMARRNGTSQNCGDVELEDPSPQSGTVSDPWYEWHSASVLSASASCFCADKNRAVFRNTHRPGEYSAFVGRAHRCNFISRPVGSRAIQVRRQRTRRFGPLESIENLTQAGLSN